MRLPETTRDLYYPCEPYRVTEPPITGTVIGKDLGALILVLESGAVVASAAGKVIPINSSLDQYRHCLATVGAARDRLAADPEDEELVNRLELELREIDANAYSERGSYWQAIVEQIRNEQF